ncbi:unnamed protein product [Psylliodes chrysocephalus]|uniref:DUF4812 domain-containing protein n=1 Tax=Psylliodes chrysocephalus TaxID=3402493 RepID=A0A9P0D453_9CUCU|nr:unnamed protein product [Psylliodes chrysocephala]
MLQTEVPRKASPATKKDRLFSPIINAISNFAMAKKLHRENLEHYPLPDTLTDAMYRKILLERQSKGEKGDEKPFATGIGWKAHSGYGPTRCTKLKIYRPKTSAPPKTDDLVSSFDRKWRFIRQAKVTPMDLAICWDLTPENPKDEPEKIKHLDGSNGSAAPAVFSLVHTPKEEEIEQKCDGIHACGPLFDHSEKGNEEKEYLFHRTKNTPPKSIHSSNSSDSKKRIKSAVDDKFSVCSKASDISIKSRAKSAYNINELNAGSHSSKDNNNNIDEKIHQSTPNLSECSLEKHCKKYNKICNKFCVACEMKGISLTDKRPKSVYKMAFKAGVPQQQKTKKKREDYPEHWRLATVYQHSYKPMYARKRPLMQTVFK